MSYNLKSFSLSIVDLFGIIIPGVIWYALFILSVMIITGCCPAKSTSIFSYLEYSVTQFGENCTVNWEDSISDFGNAHRLYDQTACYDNCRLYITSIRAKKKIFNKKDRQEYKFPYNKGVFKKGIL